MKIPLLLANHLEKQKIFKNEWILILFSRQKDHSRHTRSSQEENPKSEGKMGISRNPIIP